MDLALKLKLDQMSAEHKQLMEKMAGLENLIVEVFNSFVPPTNPEVEIKGEDVDQASLFDGAKSGKDFFVHERIPLGDPTPNFVTLMTIDEVLNTVCDRILAYQRFVYKIIDGRPVSIMEWNGEKWV